MPRVVKQKSKKPAQEIPQQEPIHILVIEDEEALWELIRHGFQRCKVPYRLTFASTLSKARDILVADPPTLVFLDWMLPDGKGEEILPEKKEDVEYPIVIMTCHGDEKLALKLIKKGAINYFVKDNVFFRQLPYITEVALKDWKLQQGRKQVEEKLKESEERYRALAESASDAIYIINKDGVVEYVNNAGKAMLGMPAKTISGCTISQLFQPQIAEQFHENIKKVIATKKPIHHEIFVPHPNTLTWIDVILTPLTTSGEPVTRVMGISRDITNQKKVEQALRDSEAQYRNVVENVPDLILVHDNGIIRYGNPALEKVIGYTSDEVINRSVMDFVVPQYRNKVRGAIQQRSGGKPVEPYEIEIRTKSGEHRTVIVKGSRIDLGGSPAFINVLTDITEQKRASEALQERERKYRELFSSITDAVFVHDFSGTLAGNFIEFNDKACQMLGYTREELARLSPTDINDPGSGTDLKMVAEKLNRGEDVIFEEVLVTRDNQRIPVEIHSHVFILGEQRSVISLVHDITERKRAAESLRDSENRLNLAIGGANLGLWDYDLVTNEIIHNTRWAEMLGYSVEELTKPALWWRERVHPDDLPAVIRNSEDHTSGKIPGFEAVYRMKHKNGEWRWVHSQGKVIVRDSTGSPVRMIGINQDITGRKQAEKELRFLAQVADDAPASITVHDFDGNFLYANEETLRLHGYTRGEFLAKNLHEIDVPESEELIAARMQKIQEKGEGNFDVRHFRKDGSTFPLHANVKTMDWGGREALLSIATDLTARKAAEEALSKSETRYRGLIELLPQTVFEIDPKGTILSVNPAGLKSFGYSKEDLENGVSAFQVFAPTDHQRLAENIKRILWGEPLAALEYTALRKDGSTFPVITYSVPIIHDHIPVGLLGVLVDISERKKAEEALRIAQEKYTKAFLSAPDAIAISELESGRFIEVNDAASTIFGYSPDEMIHKSAFELGIWLKKEDRDYLIDQIQSKGRVVQYEVIQRRKSGEKYYASVTADTITIGNSRYLIAIIRDITGHKHMEDALRESEGRFRTLADAALEGIMVHDRGVIIDCNPQFAAMFGYKPEEIIGRNGFEFMLTAESVDAISRWRQDGAQGMVDIIGIKKDGTRFYGETASTALLWQGKEHSIVQMHDITERKRAEKALRESEQNYRGVIENLQDVFYRTDAAGDIIMTSPSVAEIFGYRSTDEVIGLNLARDFYKDPAKRLEFLEEIKKTGSVRNFEAVLKRKDGSPVIVSTSAHYYHDPDGQVLGVEGIAKDITEWKHAQEALRESEEKYRVVSEMAKDGIAIVQDNRLVYVNPYCARLAGYSVEELTGASFLRFVAPESVVALLGILKDTVLGRPVPEFFSTRIRHRDGHTIEIEANGTPIIWEGKNALLGIIRDVTERNRTEEALRESEEKYRNLAETIHDFILTTDFDGIITFANPAARQLVGGRDLVGVSMKEFMDQDQIKEHLEMLSARRQGLSEPLSYEWHLISPKDGSSLLLDVRSSLLMDRGKPSGILFNARNITERKQMEDEIRTLNRTLEDRVIERTRQLDASLQEKELLLREIHHRVKNNLQIVASLLNLQSRYIKDEETLAAINESQNRVKAMALVHEKLYQAKNISKINLNEFIRFLGNSLFQFYGVKSKGIAFETEISDISVDINTAVPLGLIINELISNSLKYAFPDGRKGAISVSVRQENERYSILFRDNGIGIADGLDWRNTDSLGLRLVTSLVEQLDGTIELRKEKGTTFIISIHGEKG